MRRRDRDRRRRRVAAAVAAWAAAAVVATAAEPVPSVELGPDLRVRELGAGYWLHVSFDARGIDANGMIARVEDGLLLVDTTWNDDQAGRLVAWAEKELKAPVRRAIVTHAHNDRSGGTAALIRRRISVMALDLTVAWMRAAGSAALPEVLMKAGPAAHGGGPGFEAFYPGPGHSRDNIVVWFPQPRIVFGGCFAKAADAPNIGNVADADLVSWPKAVAAVRARYPGAAVVVPGHGPVGGVAAFDRTLELLRRGAAAP